MVDIVALARWSSTHHGVVTTPQLHQLGITRAQIRTLTGNGLLVPIRRGVYVVSTASATFLQRVAAGCAATGGAGSLTTASKVWEYRQAPHDERIHMTIEASRRARPMSTGDLVVHRSACLPKADLVYRKDGIVVTSPPRTLFDMAAVADRASLESMIEQAIERRMCTIPTLLAVADRLARPGRPGSGRFVATIAGRPAWRKPVDSHDELVLERALVAAGLPDPVRQHPVTLRSGQVVHPDLCWPDIRFAVEVDHATWHNFGAAVEYDKWRDRQLGLVGWEVRRVTDTSVRHHLPTTAEELRELYRARLTR